MEEIGNLLIKWYNTHKRELPWRKNRNPYSIWISEIMLQQTQVIQGTGYYLRFMERFPTIDILAEASQDEVMKYWQGLGYYSRARNLHATSKTIIETYNGKFPADYKKLLQLKGIGPYTAAAISSIAFGLPYAVVDGNVFRVLSRLFGVDTPINSTEGVKQFNELATTLLINKDAGTYNQAIMEFGALECTPASPNCDNCILNHKCLALSKKTVGTLPVKLKKTKQRYRYFYYFYFNYNGKTWLEQRSAKDIWEGLFQLPMFEANEQITKELAISEMFNELNINDKDVVILEGEMPEIKHILSHQILKANAFSFRIISDEIYQTLSLKYGEPISITEIEEKPVSRLMEIIIEQLIEKNNYDN